MFDAATVHRKNRAFGLETMNDTIEIIAEVNLTPLSVCRSGSFAKNVA